MIEILLAILIITMARQGWASTHDYVQTAAPSTCVVGETWFDSDTTVGRNIYGCTATDVWTLEGDGTSGSEAFPIGSVFISVVSTNPATLLGYGTWSAIGAGRVLVGLDSGDTDFDVVEETGGAKTHTLTGAEIPAHVHGELAPSSASAGALKFGIDTNASGSQASGLDTASTGGGGAHNNLQPYFTVYIWKRTL